MLTLQGEQAQERMKLPSPTGYRSAFSPCYYCLWLGLQAYLLLRNNQLSLLAGEPQSSAWTLLCLIQTDATSGSLGLSSQMYSGSPSQEASKLG